MSYPNDCTVSIAKSPERQRETEAALNRLDVETMTNGELLSSLADRLSSLVRPPGKDSIGTDSPAYSSLLASRIGAQAARAGQLNAALRDILDRLEV